MSTKIAEYKFADYDDWTGAKNRIYDALGGSNYSDSITSQSGYYIAIWENCNDPKIVGSICKAHGGEVIS